RLAWAALLLLLLPVAARAQGPELKKEAVAELYKSREKAALSKMLAILLGRPAYGPRDKAAEQILLTLGDKGGDLYDLTETALLTAARPASGQGEWQQFRLARILARCDSKRAYRTFRRLLDNAPSLGLKKALLRALPDLESEDGLKLLFAHLEGGNNAESALDAVIRLMYPERDHHPGISHRAKRMPGPRWAKMQDLAVPRLQTLLKDKSLPGEVHQRAMWGENFVRLVDDTQFYAHQMQFVGISSAGAPRQKTLPAQPADYAS